MSKIRFVINFVIFLVGSALEEIILSVILALIIIS